MLLTNWLSCYEGEQACNNHSPAWTIKHVRSPRILFSLHLTSESEMCSLRLCCKKKKKTWIFILQSYCPSFWDIVVQIYALDEI